MRLTNGSVGVIGGLVPSGGAQQYRVHFDISTKTISADSVAETFSPQTFSVGDSVSLWPYSGVITAINGDEFTLSIERQELLEKLGPITWTGVYVAPRWRIVLDNDTRVRRVW